MHEVKYTINFNAMPYGAASVTVSNTQLCISTPGNAGTGSVISVMTVQLIAGEPYYEPDLHDLVVTVKGQSEFPC